MMKHTVSECKNCPFYEFQDEMMDMSCRHPKGEWITIRSVHAGLNIPITPKDCPLLNEAIRVSFGKADSKEIILTREELKQELSDLWHIRGYEQGDDDFDEWFDKTYPA